jgi:hypothetical protein
VILPTCIPKLDTLLSGGVPGGRSLLYLIQPGIDGSVFGLQTAVKNIENGMQGVFVVSTTHPSKVQEYVEGFGWDFDVIKDRLNIIDLHSGLTKAPSDAKHVVDDPEDLESIDATMTKAIDDSTGALLFFESLSTIMDLCGEERSLEFVHRWLKQARLNDCVVIANFTAWPYAEDTVARIRDKIFNAVVRVGGVGERVMFGQYYGVLRADWLDSQNERTLLFKVSRPGGVKVYIPKLLVTGPFNAGKSTFVHALSNASVSVDRLGTTVALDFGHIDHKEFSADIFGTPGQERFDPILKLLGGQALGVFLVVDSTDPGGFSRAKQMLESTKTYDLPFVVVANKQDRADAISVDEIRKQMTIPEEIPIIPVAAKEGEGVYLAFETLVDSIIQV